MTHKLRTTGLDRGRHPMSTVELGTGGDVQMGEHEADAMSGQFLGVCLRRSGLEKGAGDKGGWSL